MPPASQAVAPTVTGTPAKAVGMVKLAEVVVKAEEPAAPCKPAGTTATVPEALTVALGEAFPG